MDKKRFTFTELCVVCGMLFLLFTLLGNAAEKALQKAREKSCVGNLRVIGQACSSYATDNASFIPCRPKPDGTLIYFGTFHSEGSLPFLLAKNGYFGEKPTGPSKNWLPNTISEFFACPEDKATHKPGTLRSSYFIHQIDAATAVKMRRYGEELFARVNLETDRPENSICFDVFPYKQAEKITPNHGNVTNVLRLNGSVDQVDCSGALKGNIWNWIAEVMDEIEL